MSEESTYNSWSFCKESVPEDLAAYWDQSFREAYAEFIDRYCGPERAEECYLFCLGIHKWEGGVSLSCAYVPKASLDYLDDDFDCGLYRQDFSLTQQHLQTLLETKGSGPLLDGLRSCSRKWVG